MAVVVFSVVTTFCGDRLGDALGSREHELAEGVRNVGFLGWFFLTFPGYDLATGSRFASTRGTRILVAVAALPISVSVAYLI
ncbi:MAG TPA: hypothetical protein VM938_07215 [Acidimicrobiales bacterium]|nr:hypothetical protein [Acidimicrobiales bacterium]